MTLKQKSGEEYREGSGEDEMVFFAVPKREEEDDSRYSGSPYGGEDWEESYFEKRSAQEKTTPVSVEPVALVKAEEKDTVPDVEVNIARSRSPYVRHIPTTRTARNGAVFSDIVPSRRLNRSTVDLPVFAEPVQADLDPEEGDLVVRQEQSPESVAPVSFLQEEPEQSVAVQEVMPVTPERVFEREYPEYAYRHLGQRFFEPPKEYFYFEPEAPESEVDTESEMEILTAEEENEEDVEEVRAENIELFPNIQKYAELAEPEPMPGYIGSEYWEGKRTSENFSDTTSEVLEELEEEGASIPVEDVEHIGSEEWEERSFFGLKKIARKIFGFFATFREVFSPGPLSWSAPKFSYAYVLLGGALLLGFGGVSYISRGLSLQGSVLGVTNRGVDDALSAVGDLRKQNFAGSSQQFELAAGSFHSASAELSSWAGVLSDVPSSIPFLSKVSSGSNALKAGEHLALAGKYMSEMVGVVATLRNSDEQKPSLLSIFQKGVGLSEQARNELTQAQTFLEKVRLLDIPEEKRDRFAQLKQTVPLLLAGLDVVHTNAPAFTDVLGGNGPRKYLFLFQNNQEARATGGFIGSYGVLDMKDGSIRKFFIDGIFNPDGQLREDIVPPQPIRKVSAAWSMHDSNWFADFPTSAEKAISFYEKTGGPTVDGVITITPVVLQRILTATGPVYLSEYDVTIDAENVIPTLQYKVEEDYDKEENRPKKILGDLAPILLDRLMQMQDPESASRLVEVLHSSLLEKHVLLYSRNSALQTMYREMGWSGELKDTSNDFLSVVNSNINGFKTDGMIDQSVHHSAQIDEDGTITDTVKVTRKHNGGDTPYEWWNGVNADYMRLYVPKGAKLLSVSGQTRETVKDPLDYNALEFHRDDLVTQIESTLQTDQSTGTQVFEESGKTVFGNWVYVSPKESVTIEYVYTLPFRALQEKSKNVISYSLLTQKQSGSVTSEFVGDVSYPKEWQSVWLSPDVREASGSVSFTGELRTDVFQGYVFTK